MISLVFIILMIDFVVLYCNGKLHGGYFKV